MVDSSFHATANDFIKSLIKQRRFLINAGKSYGNAGFINQSLFTLEKFMGAYKYDTDEKMANFWAHHSDEIYALIPGRSSGSHATMLKVYLTLNTLARNLYNNPVPWYEPLMYISAN